MAYRQTERNHQRPFLTLVPPEQIPVAGPVPMDLVLVYKTCLELRDLCVKERGKGISAVQVGIPWDLFVISGLPGFLRIKDDSYGYFVGCTYGPVGPEQVESLEGCLSLKSPSGDIRTFRVSRYIQVRVTGQRLVDTPSLALIEFNQVLDLNTDAIVFQHECDHGKSVLISDIGKEVCLW